MLILTGFGGMPYSFGTEIAVKTLTFAVTHTRLILRLTKDALYHLSYSSNSYDGAKKRRSGRYHNGVKPVNNIF